MTDWKPYLKATQQRKPIQLLVDAISIMDTRRGTALDLGCGAGVDAKFLAESGFEVVAVDSDPDAVAATKDLVSGLSVDVQQGDIGTYDLGNEKFDLILAWKSIPFVSPEPARQAMVAIPKALKPGGVVVISLFGPADEWNRTKQGMTFFSLDELKSLWSTLEFLRLDEEQAQAKLAAGGTKFNHRIEVIAKRPDR